MIEKDENGINVIVFGSGDIEIGAGHLDSTGDNWVFVSFGQSVKGKIGRQIRDYSEYGCQPELMEFKHHTRLVFTNLKSIDVVMAKLIEAKKRMVNDDSGVNTLIK